MKTRFEELCCPAFSSSSAFINGNPFSVVNRQSFIHIFFPLSRFNGNFSSRSASICITSFLNGKNGKLMEDTWGRVVLEFHLELHAVSHLASRVSRPEPPGGIVRLAHFFDPSEVSSISSPQTFLSLANFSICREESQQSTWCKSQRQKLNCLEGESKSRKHFGCFAFVVLLCVHLSCIWLSCSLNIFYPNRLLVPAQRTTNT